MPLRQGRTSLGGPRVQRAFPILCLALALCVAAEGAWARRVLRLLEQGPPLVEAPGGGMLLQGHARLHASARDAFESRVARPAAGDLVEVPLFSGELRRFTVERVRALPKGGLALSARNPREGSSLFLAYRKGALHGSIQMKGDRTLELDGDAQGQVRVRERRPLQGDSDAPLAPPAGAVPASAAGTADGGTYLPPPSTDFNSACGATSTPAVVDLLVLYDAQCMAAQGGPAAMQLRIETDVEGLNDALTAGRTNALFRLVEADEVVWPGDNGDAGSALAAAPALSDTAGVGVPAVRSAVGGDEVLFYYNGGSVGTVGEAWIMQTPGAAFAPYAYAAVSIGGPMTTACHELGHNLGCMHEAGNGAFPYSHAYASVGGNRTIMCATVGNLDLFSSPQMVYNGETYGSAGSQDNARTILQDAPIAAAYYTPVVPETFPLVDLTSPGDGATPAEGGAVTLTADASSANGIGQVDFFYDGIQFASALAPPYQAVSPLLGGGTHYFWARAVDTTGLSSYTCPATVTAQTTLSPWQEADWITPLALGPDFLDWAAGVALGTGYPACAVQSGGSLTLYSDGTSGGPADTSLFVCQQFCGNGLISAQVPAAPGAADTVATAYIELRGGLGPSDPAYKIGLNAARGYTVFTRTAAGAVSVTAEMAPRAAGWLSIVRTGGVAQGFTSPDGATWTAFGSPFTLATPSDAWAGLEWGGDQDLNLAACTFANVTLTSLCAARTGTPTSTATRTASPTVTSTRTATSTATVTPTRTVTQSATPTPTVTPTRTVTGTATGSPTVSPTFTATSTRSPTSTASPTASPTATRSATPTPSPTASPTGTRSGTPTASPSQSPTPTHSGTATASPTAGPTPTISATLTRSPTGSPTGSVTASPTPSPTASPTGTSTGSPTASPTASPTGSATASPGPSPTASSTASSTAAPSCSPTGSVSATLSACPTSTATPACSSSPTSSSTGTVSGTPTDSPGGTQTVTATDTATDRDTATGTATAIGTNTASATASPNASATGSWTPVSGASSTGTPTPTASPSPTAAQAGLVPVPSATPEPGPVAIGTACPVPNPNPAALKALLEGPVDSIELRVYTPAMVCAGTVAGGAESQGWATVPLPADFVAAAPNGVYFFRMTARRGGSESKSVQGTFMVLR